jgi:hypothetical protein
MALLNFHRYALKRCHDIQHNDIQQNKYSPLLTLATLGNATLIGIFVSRCPKGP